MIICRNCGLHRFNDNKSCPHCSTNQIVRKSGARRTALALLMGFAAVGCGDKEDDSGQDSDSGDTIVEPADDMAMYGVPFTDEDGDGYAAEEDDCNDQDPNIHPGAEETAGDDVDSNCNGDDDT